MFQKKIGFFKFRNYRLSLFWWLFIIYFLKFCLSLFIQLGNVGLGFRVIYVESNTRHFCWKSEEARMMGRSSFERVEGKKSIFMPLGLVLRLFIKQAKQSEAASTPFSLLSTSKKGHGKNGPCYPNLYLPSWPQAP